MKSMEKGVVLIVEDNLKLAELNRRVLEEEGCVTLVAGTLSEARKYLKLSDPDIVILDIMLPDGSGFDLMAEINERKSFTQVIFLTAKKDKEYVIAGLEAGGIDYIKKPYDISEFRGRVMNHLKVACELRRRKVPVIHATKLTKRELIVAARAAEGMSNKEIANEIFLSESRVKSCLGEVYRKFNIVDEKDKRSKLVEFLGG